MRTVLNIWDEESQSYKGIPCIKGEKGEKGDTPQKGIDYDTEEDKAEMVEAVLLALPDGDEVSY